MIVYLKYGEEESSPNPISLLSQLYGPLDHTYGKIKGGQGGSPPYFNNKQ